MRGKRTAPSIIEFATDPQLLGLSLSPAQETCLRGVYGLPLLSEGHRTLWQQCTGRPTYPGHPFGEVSVVAGARAGKDSRIAAPVVCFEAIFGGHERHLAKGERAVIPLVAQDQRATRVAFSYIREYLTRSPLLSSTIEEILSLEILLSNRVSILCFPCTLRSLRGWSIPAGVMDELAFFRLEGQADSDAEIQASIRRGMVSFPAPRLVKISTPYMKSGVLWDDFRRAWAQDNPDVLIWRAPSVLMNPSLKAERLERERRLDPERYLREYEAEFLDDLEAFLPGAWVDGVVIPGRHELPPQPGVVYVAAVDPSGGGPDAFTLAIVHLEGGRIVQDVMRGWARVRGGTVDLEGIVRECAHIVKGYGCPCVLGDRYAGHWVRQAFEREGIAYVEAPDKARGYLEVEPFFAQGRIDLVDHPTLLRELKTLERRPRAGGRVMIDHPHGGHDDYANALALAASGAGSLVGATGRPSHAHGRPDPLDRLREAMDKGASTHPGVRIDAPRDSPSQRFAMELCWKIHTSAGEEEGGGWPVRGYNVPRVIPAPSMSHVNAGHCGGSPPTALRRPLTR